jgi:hypothetical protein
MLTPKYFPCIPTKAAKVPDRPGWIHEIKHDGYQLIIQRDGKRVRLFTRNGHDWSERYPLITEAALRNRNSLFVIDGEAVLLGVDGRSDFDGLHSRRHDHEIEFYAFDCLVSDGDDLRRLPLSMRKGNLAKASGEAVFILTALSIWMGLAYRLGPSTSLVQLIVEASRSTALEDVGFDAFFNFGQCRGVSGYLFSVLRHCIFARTCLRSG